MGMDYTTTVGFGFELWDRELDEQIDLVEKYFNIDVDLDDDLVDKEFQKSYPLLSLALTGDFWGGDVYWSVFAKSTKLELTPKGRVSQEECSADELAALQAFAKQHKALVSEAKPEWHTLQSVV